MNKLNAIAYDVTIVTVINQIFLDKIDYLQYTILKKKKHGETICCAASKFSDRRVFIIIYNILLFLT